LEVPLIRAKWFSSGNRQIQFRFNFHSLEIGLSMFSDRIQRRKQLWWRNSGGGQTLMDDLRRLEMLHARVGRDAPQSRWRRGQYWQRRLLNKLNAREFAIGHDCQVPELYWHGRFLSRSVLASLPGQFVLKPAVGAAHRGIHLMAGSRDLLSGADMTRDQLFDRVAATRGRFSHIPLLAEEFVTTERGAHVLAIDYKFHMFRDVVGAIQVIHRQAEGQPTAHRFYTREWQPFADAMNTFNVPAGVIDAPLCLPQLIDTAVKLGTAFDSYVRVDLYATSKGGVFGEFSSVPTNGRHFTPYADELFEKLWRENCGDKI